MKGNIPFTPARLSPAEFRARKKPPFVFVLDSIRSAHNVGAAFRICDAFLISHIYLCGITATPPHPQIAKTALGAEAIVNWTQVDDSAALLHQLRKKGYYIIAVEQTITSIPLQTFTKSKLRQPCAFIFGNEVFGVRQEVIQNVDACVEIPQYGTKISMNVSVCIGIVAWEVLKDWPKAQ